MGINVGGIEFKIPAGPVDLPDINDLIAGVEDAPARMSAGARAELEQAKEQLTAVGGEMGAAFIQEATKLAALYKRGGGDNFNDCIPIVIAGMAYSGALKAGKFGAALGAGGGLYAARIACRYIFPEQEDDGVAGGAGAVAGNQDQVEYVIVRAKNDTARTFRFQFLGYDRTAIDVAMKPHTRWWWWSTTGDDFWASIGRNRVYMLHGQEQIQFRPNIVATATTPTWNLPNEVGKIHYLRVRGADGPNDPSIVIDLVQTH